MTTENANRKFSWLAEICEGIGPVSLHYKMRKLLKELPEETFESRLALLEPSIGSKRGRDISALLEENHIHTVCLFDDSYPDLLRHCADPPLFLFYSGDLKALHRPCISVIGARACTSYGIQTTRQIAGELARMGFTIVSGLALGIDAIAHQAALEVKGCTASVLGSGIRVIYPRQHTGLAREIVRNHGIVLTEFPPQENPKPHHFPMRNRIISGLSHATIVIEAEKKSGTLITAQFCLDQGRELFAVPGPLNRATSEGTHQLISNGEAQIFTSISNFLLQFESLIQNAVVQEKKLALKINDPIMRTIYDSLDAFEPSCFDLLMAELAQTLNISAGELGAKLTQLEAEGFISSLPGQKFLRNPLYQTGENSV